MKLHYESRFGLARGAVFVGGKPHLYAEGYDSDASPAALGARSIARLTGRAGGIGFLELVDGGAAILDAGQEVVTAISDGTAVEIEIAAEGRRDKRARARLLRVATGEALQQLSAPLALRDRLAIQARTLIGKADILPDDDDSDAIDTAAEEALAVSLTIPGGGALSIERTRALIACDVDSAGGEGTRPSRAFIKTCNEAAVTETARRLRLSGLAGLVVIDLIGRRHDGERMRRLLETGFGVEAPRIVAVPVTRFGTLEFIRPWGACPAMDVSAPLRVAGDVLRQAVARAAGQPGRLVTLRAPQDILDIIRPLTSHSYDPLAPLLRLEAGVTPEVLV